MKMCITKKDKKTIEKIEDDKERKEELEKFRSSKAPLFYCCTWNPLYYMTG
jgi:hypothetical protein